MNKFHKLLSTAVLSFIALLPLASPADAISFSLNLNWEAFGSDAANSTVRYFLTGSFTAEDLDGDGFIRATNESLSDGNLDNDEVIDFAVSFNKDPDTNLVEYNFGEIKSDPNFTFNYDIANKTILQTGDTAGLLDALYIGNRTSSFSGFSLDSFSGVLSLVDVKGLDNAQGGVLTASAPSPVPFEFEASGGILMLGAAWLLRKRLQKKAANN